MTLLKELGSSGPDLSVTELSTRLGLHKSTVSRLLYTLASGGFAEQNVETGRYRLGLQLASLAALAVTQLDLRDAAHPYLVDLAAESGETATLSVLDSNEAVNIDQVPGAQPVRDVGWIGRRLPLHATAAGKPLLAALPAKQLAGWTQGALSIFTERTVRTAAELRRELQQVRTKGYAVAVEEYEEGLTAVGAAVLDYRGQVAASITVSGPSFRLSTERLPATAELVRAAAARISHRLGYWPNRATGQQERSQTPPGKERGGSR